RCVFFFQAEDGIRDGHVTGVQTCALPIWEPRFLRPDGSAGTVLRTASLLPEEPLPASAPLVLQVSRWDRLKDPVGVLRGFAHVRSEERRVGKGWRLRGGLAVCVALCARIR